MRWSNMLPPKARRSRARVGARLPSDRESVKRVFLILLVGNVLLTSAASGSATAAQEFAFRTPDNSAYCGYIQNGWRCISPLTGLPRQAGASASPRQQWASSDAEVIRCRATRASLNCAHYTGLRLTVTRTGIIRTFLDDPGSRPRVQPLFRTGWGAYCGIATDNLEPTKPLFQCWNANNGTVVGVAHDNSRRPGSFGRLEKARGYRPSDFSLLEPGKAFVWRCRTVTEGSADRCSATTGKSVFRCAATAPTLRCVNTRGHGFTLAPDGSFTVF